MAAPDRRQPRHRLGACARCAPSSSSSTPLPLRSRPDVGSDALDALRGLSPEHRRDRPPPPARLHAGRDRPPARSSFGTGPEPRSRARPVAGDDPVKLDHGFAAGGRRGARVAGRARSVRGAHARTWRAQGMAPRPRAGGGGRRGRRGRQPTRTGRARLHPRGGGHRARSRVSLPAPTRCSWSRQTASGSSRPTARSDGWATGARRRGHRSDGSWW